MDISVGHSVVDDNRLAPSDKQTASSERLQNRLDEASFNKTANRRMEDRDKNPQKHIQRSKDANRSPPSTQSGSGSSGKSSSIGAIAVTGGGRQLARYTGGQLVRAQPSRVCPMAAYRQRRNTPPNDQGEYCIRRHRKEVRSAKGVVVLEVKEYSYWPPRCRGST
jgi:hypothetical protein